MPTAAAVKTTIMSHPEAFIASRNAALQGFVLYEDEAAKVTERLEEWRGELVSVQFSISCGNLPVYSGCLSEVVVIPAIV